MSPYGSAWAAWMKLLLFVTASRQCACPHGDDQKSNPQVHGRNAPPPACFIWLANAHAPTADLVEQARRLGAV